MGFELNLVNLMDVLQEVTEVDNLGLHLGVPKHELDKIRQDFHTTEERKMAMLTCWLNHKLNPTWAKVIAALKAMHKPVLAKTVAEISKCQSLYEPGKENLNKVGKLEEKQGLEVNLVNLIDVLQNVAEVDNLGYHLGVPGHELDKIRQDFHTTEEQKRAMWTWWLDNDLNCTWEKVITALRAIHKPVLADAVEQVSKRQSLYEPDEMDLRRWEENLDKVSKLEEKLREVQQRSEHLEKEWEKGETEWREYLEKLMKIEEDWKDLVRTQRTEIALLTLGISRLLESNLESLHRQKVLEHKVEQQVERSKELREFCRRVAEHQHGLQDTETELKELENALLKQESELQNRINQMEELGSNFSGEAKDCREQLENSQNRLQICRKKINECRDEFTKSHRQLKKFRMTLAEYELHLKLCNDELSENHSQITKCIEGMQKESKELSGQIAALTVTAGGLVGGGVGTAAAIGAVGGPVGAATGAVVGLVFGILGGVVFADHHEKTLEKARAKLRRCERELNDCGNVVESCKEVLWKSQEELEELKQVVSELEQFFELKDQQEGYISTIKMSLQKDFESFAKTTFVVTGSHSHSFEWQGYGLKIHIPEGAVPAEHTECRIDIKVGFPGHFSFPDDSQLVSFVYWISCSQKFLKSVTLDIEHCAAVQDDSQSSSLCFVVAKCSQTEFLYQIKEIKQAAFSTQSFYGSVKVSHFSLFGIITKVFPWLRRYCAIFYYSKESHKQWWLYFFITWNLSGYREATKTMFTPRGRKDDGSEWLVVKFQDNSISLDIPRGGVVLESGWKISPMAHPGITKQEVDRSCQWGQGLPHCCLSIEWTREEKPNKLEHIVDLNGAKWPSNYFCIVCNPEEYVPDQPLVCLPHPEYTRRANQAQMEICSYHGERPTLPKLLNFPTRSGSYINIPRQIGTKYFQFGIQLLNDETGEEIEAIVSRHREKAEEVNLKILSHWIGGKGKPLDWDNLIQVLKAIGLGTLASDIEDGLQHH